MKVSNQRYPVGHLRSFRDTVSAGVKFIDYPVFGTPGLDWLQKSFMTAYGFGYPFGFGTCEPSLFPSGYELTNVVTEGTRTARHLKADHAASDYARDAALFTLDDFGAAESLLVSLWITRTGLNGQAQVISLGLDDSYSSTSGGLFIDCLSSGYSNRLRMYVGGSNTIEDYSLKLNLTNQAQHLLVYLRPGAYALAVDGACSFSTSANSFITQERYAPRLRFGGWNAGEPACYEGLCIWKDVSLANEQFRALAALLYGNGLGRWPEQWGISGASNFNIRLSIAASDGTSTAAEYSWIGNVMPTITNTGSPAVSFPQDVVADMTEQSKQIGGFFSAGGDLLTVWVSKLFTDAETIYRVFLRRGETTLISAPGTASLCLPLSGSTEDGRTYTIESV